MPPKRSFSSLISGISGQQPLVQQQQPPPAKRARTSGGSTALTRVTLNQEIGAAMGRTILTAESDLAEWDIGEYKKDARLIIVLGKRNTGKTTFAVNFLHAHRDVYPFALVVTATKFNGFWQQYFPAHCIMSNFDPVAINLFFEAQKDRVLLRGANSRVLILFDDMASSTALRYSEELTTIAYNGRHYNADVMYLTQDVVKATTAMRRNADAFVMLRTTGQPSLDHVYKEYASIDFANFAHFQAVMLKVTDNWGCFVIDNSDPNLTAEQRYLKYYPKKSDDLPQFTMLCPAAWHARNPTERAIKANEQREKFARPKKYSRNYMRQLKNCDTTLVTRQQVLGQTETHERMKMIRNPIWDMTNGI
jgi:hypothetical protein